MKDKKSKSKSKRNTKKNKLDNSLNTEEDGENVEELDALDLEHLVENFRDTYISNLVNNNKKGPFGNELATISIDDYKQLQITPEIQKKILRLQAITKSIEKNLVRSVHKKKNKKFRIDYEKSLNKMQYAAATTINGPLLVIAGAGSGKTRAIVYRTAFLLENGIPPQNILLLTFTRKAANEMLARTASLLNDMKSQKVMGGTFHSFANNLLRQHSKLLGISPNFTIIDTADSEDVIDFIRHELHFEKRKRAFPKKGIIQKIISYSRNCEVSIKKTIEHRFEYLTEFTKDIKIITKIYSEYKKAHNLFDFDDLMEFLRNSLKKNSKFRKKVQESFQYIMVDEFQDTNIIQKEIVDLIAKKYRNIMVVGDDSQSIYSFRGANFENILRFPETYPDCKFVKIEQNYRSTQEILGFTNSVISNAKIGYKKKLFSAKKKGDKPVVKRFYSKEDEAKYVVSEIIDLREHEIPLNQIAVLCRAIFHSNFIQAELILRKIPFIVVGGLRFSERRHVKDIVAYLRIVLNPLDPVAWNRVLKLIPNIGNISASKIIKHMRKLNGKIDFSNFEGYKFYKDLQELGSVINRISNRKISLPDKVEILKEYYSPILAYITSDYKIRLMDINVLYNLASKYNDLEKFLSAFALDPPSNKFQDRNTLVLDEKNNEKPLVISTIHSAKGLEWDTVFVPHLIDGLFPSEMNIENIEEVEEERRLFYVACTRAKERLYLTMPSYSYKRDASFTLPSRFLVEVDKEKYNFIKSDKYTEFE